MCSDEKINDVDFDVCTYDIYPYDWMIGKHITSHMHMADYIEKVFGEYYFNGYIEVPTAYMHIDGCRERKLIEVNYKTYQPSHDTVRVVIPVSNPDNTNDNVTMSISLHKPTRSATIEYTRSKYALLDSFVIKFGLTKQIKGEVMNHGNRIS